MYYQYVYLNSFIGKFENSHTKFENDYWGLSLKELIKNIENETLNANKHKATIPPINILFIVLAFLY